MPKRDYYDDPAAPTANSIVVVVGAAVRNEHGELLLIEHTVNGLWALPDGAQDFGESVIQAVGGELRSSSESRRVRWIPPDSVLVSQGLP